MTVKITQKLPNCAQDLSDDEFDFSTIIDPNVTFMEIKVDDE